MFQLLEVTLIDELTDAFTASLSRPPQDRRAEAGLSRSSPKE